MYMGSHRQLSPPQPFDWTSGNGDAIVSLAAMVYIDDGHIQ
jgi:hypothetical protein